MQSRRASKMDLLEGTILGKEEAEHHDMMHQLVGWLRGVWCCVCVCVCKVLGWFAASITRSFLPHLCPFPLNPSLHMPRTCVIRLRSGSDSGARTAPRTRGEPRRVAAPLGNADDLCRHPRGSRQMPLLHRLMSPIDAPHVCVPRRDSAIANTLTTRMGFGALLAIALACFVELHNASR